MLRDRLWGGTLAKRHPPVGTLRLDRPDEPLGVCTRVRRPVGRWDDPEPSPRRGTRAGLAPPRIAITDHHPVLYEKLVIRKSERADQNWMPHEFSPHPKTHESWQNGQKPLGGCGAGIAWRTDVNEAAPATWTTNERDSVSMRWAGADSTPALGPTGPPVAGLRLILPTIRVGAEAACRESRWRRTPLSRRHIVGLRVVSCGPAPHSGHHPQERSDDGDDGNDGEPCAHDDGAPFRIRSGGGRLARGVRAADGRSGSASQLSAGRPRRPDLTAGRWRLWWLVPLRLRPGYDSRVVQSSDDGADGDAVDVHDSVSRDRAS